MSRLLPFGPILALIATGCALLPSQDPGNDTAAPANAIAPSPTNQSEAPPSSPTPPRPADAGRADDGTARRQ